MTELNLGAVSYGVGAGMFLVLTALLLTAWRGRLQGGLLVSATAISSIWCATVAYHFVASVPPFSALLLVEILRDAAWFVFLFRLLGLASGAGGDAGSSLRTLAAATVGGCVALAAFIVWNRYATELRMSGSATRSAVIFGHLVLALVGLTLAHQLFRNSRGEHRWAIKYLCFGLGGLFVYDFYLYSNALLFKNIDGILWVARGVINAAIVPFIAVSAARNPDWSLDVFVSRHVVFHSAALLGAGVYLILMAAAGYYLRYYGGTWGAVAQTIFLFLAVMLLVAVMMSGQVRARAKVFLGKHFFRNKYDYREEWLRFTHTLSRSRGGAQLEEDVVRAVADIVASPGGVLWTADGAGHLAVTARWNAAEPAVGRIAADAPLPRFLERTGWIVLLDEYRAEPDRYDELDLPGWLVDEARSWVVVPLMQGDLLVAFIVLRRSDTIGDLNWEDTDLLKTVGRQAASYLALVQANEALTEARQFEAFNRLSAYVVHDLKNIVAQLGLVCSNAKRHIHSPGFVEDAIDTVGNATAKMNRMLTQLRKGRLETGDAREVRLDDILSEVVRSRSATAPSPVLEAGDSSIRVTAEPDRLAAVLEHLVQNAQEATPPQGRVRIGLGREGEWAVIEVEDDGCGMDARFVAERLFKPFDTTKGNAGMGVGVYESREFVRSVGGEIEVESRPSEGTRFRIKLPLSVGAAEDPMGSRGNVELAS